jgi:hypothetical protein
MKLAPPQNKLQPLTPADIQAAQLSQQNQDLTPGQTTTQSTGVSPIAFSAGPTTVFPWIIIIVLVAIVAAGIWFWRSF